MDYVVVGSGPCGASLSYLLSKHNYTVTLIERDSQLGGSWNSQWIDGKYWSENAPRVLTASALGNFHNNFVAFLNDLGMKSNDYDNVYYGGIGAVTHVSNSLIKLFSILDVLKLAVMIIIALVYIPNQTVQEWMDNVSLSDTGRKALRMFCILIQSEPKQFMLDDFVNSIVAVPEMKQLKQPNKWNTLLENDLKRRKNTTVLKNTEVIRLGTCADGSQVDKVWVRNRSTGEIYPVTGKKIVLSIESPALLRILNASNEVVKHNWNDYGWIKKWCEDSYYVGFGFQLHFDKPQKMPSDWCWSCMDDWTVVITDNGKWLSPMSRDKNVKAVWSCCIVTTDTMSRYLKKTANECNEKEVLDECVRQINTRLKQGGLAECKPYKITTSEGLRKVDGRWLSQNTGFARGKMGYLPMRGKLSNLFCLGSCTDIGEPGVTVCARSVDASLHYLARHEPRVKGFTHQNNQNYQLVLMFAIMASVFYYYKFK